jgi:hypothetical protein
MANQEMRLEKGTSAEERRIGRKKRKREKEKKAAGCGRRAGMAGG